MAIIDVARIYVEMALPGVQVIHADQIKANSPSPRIDYATVKILSDNTIGRDPQEILTNTPGDLSEAPEYVLQRSQIRQGTLRVEIRGSNAEDNARFLQWAHRRLAIHLYLRSENVVINKLSDVLDVTDLRANAWQPTAQVDLKIRWRLEETENQPPIESQNTQITYS